MKSLILFLVYLFLITPLFLIKGIGTHPTFAQENHHDDFVNEGSIEVNENTHKTEEETHQQLTREQKEEDLEQELHIHQEGFPLNEIPLPYENLEGIDNDNNLPY